jgi:hypothetical protein
VAQRRLHADERAVPGRCNSSATCTTPRARRGRC